MSSSEKSVLITGANGFIGSRLCRRFLDEGYDVIAGVRKTADLSLLDGLKVTFRYGDITDPASLPRMVEDVDYIIHNAGVVKASSRETFFNVNEIGTRNVLEAVVKRGREIKKLVYISSVAVAGPSHEDRPVIESDPPNPITTYGESKAAGEKAAISYRDRLPIVSVRPPGVYGPGDKEMMALFSTVNYRLILKIGNVKRRLQLVHVDDLCRGLFLAATGKTESGAIYFIAERKAYSIKQLMSILQKAGGRRGIPVIIPSALFKLIAGASEMLFKLVGATPMLTREKTRELLASWEISTRRARDELGFESKIDLEQGAKETFDWYREHGWF